MISDRLNIGGEQVRMGPQGMTIEYRVIGEPVTPPVPLMPLEGPKFWLVESGRPPLLERLLKFFTRVWSKLTFWR